MAVTSPQSTGALTPDETVPARPEGPAAAAFLAAGVGALALGFLTTLGEANADAATWLTFNKSVGPLSGKTIIAVVVWLVAWAVLHPLLKNRGRLSTATLATGTALIIIGVLGTFPTFFQAFE
jgi:hypothetical protein